MAIEFFVSGKARWQVGWYPHYNCSGCSAFWGLVPQRLALLLIGPQAREPAVVTQPRFSLYAGSR